MSKVPFFQMRSILIRHSFPHSPIHSLTHSLMPSTGCPASWSENQSLQSCWHSGSILTNHLSPFFPHLQIPPQTPAPLPSPCHPFWPHTSWFPLNHPSPSAIPFTSPPSFPFTSQYPLSPQLQTHPALPLTRVADPDPVFLHGSGSGSGFQISLDPDPVFKFSAKILENCRKVSKSDLSEENLKFMTKDRPKMKKATISY